MEIKGSTVEKLEEIQNSLYRNLLNVPFTTPKASLIWEMGGIKMKFRIMQRKLIFMNHILHLEEDSLAKQVQRVQQAHGVPGLTSEVETYIEYLGLPNCFLIYIPQKKWKPLVKKAILKANETEIREDLKKYKKVKIKEEEKFETKEYLSSLPLIHARTLFKHKYSMSEYVKMNFKGDKSFSKALWKCDKCKNPDSESHLLWCPGYENFRVDLDLDTNSDLCLYLQKIFKLRCQESTT